MSWATKNMREVLVGFIKVSNLQKRLIDKADELPTQPHIAPKDFAWVREIRYVFSKL